MTLRISALLAFTVMVAMAHAQELRIGMIGLDTSHCVAFTNVINDAAHPKHVAGGKVVAAFKGGSPDIESSSSRVEGYTRQMQKQFNVKIVDTIDDLLAQVEAVMIESVDGRPHLEQARPVIAAGKRLFIDKPVAGSLKDAIEIYRLAREKNVPVFTSSAYRFYDSMIELKKIDVGEVRGAISYGPAHLEPHHPDLFWYGVHPVEALFTVMGTGCQSVTRVTTGNTSVVTGIWSGERLGTLHALTGEGQATPHRVIVFGTKGVAIQQEGADVYAPLVAEIMKFFQTGVAPVSAEETLEMFAFMEAADESKRQGGKPVAMPEIKLQP